MSGRAEGRSYILEMAQAAHRVYKKLDPPVQRRLKVELQEIATNPYSAPLLQGLPADIRSHHFTLHGVHWRIAFTIDEEHAKVVVALIGVRENFYDRLKRLL